AHNIMIATRRHFCTNPPFQPCSNELGSGRIMTPKLMKTIALLFITMVATVALAQSAREGRQLADAPYTLKVDVDLAVFNVTVLDHKDRRVSGLGKANFRVFEQGQPQPIDFFRADDVPATIGLVIDTSGSM